MACFFVYIYCTLGKIHKTFIKIGASPVAQMVNNPSAVQETQETWVDMVTVDLKERIETIKICVGGGQPYGVYS